jgi:hypothetical protein
MKPLTSRSAPGPELEHPEDRPVKEQQPPFATRQLRNPHLIPLVCILAEAGSIPEERPDQPVVNRPGQHAIEAVGQWRRQQGIRPAAPVLVELAKQPLKAVCIEGSKVGELVTRIAVLAQVLFPGNMHYQPGVMPADPQEVLDDWLGVQDVLEHVRDDHDVESSRFDREVFGVAANSNDAGVLGDLDEVLECDVKRHLEAGVHLPQVRCIRGADVQHALARNRPDELDQLFVARGSVAFERLREVVRRHRFVVGEVPLIGRVV